MSVVVDSSVLIAMAKVRRLELLRTLYEQVLVPRAVRDEVIVAGRRLQKKEVADIEEAVKTDWIKVVPLTDDLFARAQGYRAGSRIGQGEAEAIVLANSLKVPIVLDDRDARELARRIGIEFTGTAAVLLEARLRGLLSETGFLEGLRDLSRVMWLSPDVIAELMRRAKEVKQE